MNSGPEFGKVWMIQLRCSFTTMPSSISALAARSIHINARVPQDTAPAPPAAAPPMPQFKPMAAADRKLIVSGKGVSVLSDLGGRRIIRQRNTLINEHHK